MQLCSKCRAHGKSSKSAMTILCLGIRACQNLKNTTIHRERGFTKPGKTRQTWLTQHIWVQFIFFKTILSSDTLGGGFKDWNGKSRLPIFFQEKSCIWPHCNNMFFFQEDWTPPKLGPAKQDQFWIWKWNKSQSENSFIQSSTSSPKISRLLHDRCHCEKRDFWMASPAEATENRSGSTWGHTVGGLEGESIPKGVVMMCRKNTSENYFCEINIIWWCLIVWMWFDDFEWFWCAFCVILYIMMIIGALMMVVPPWCLPRCLPRWISHQELGTAFAAREEEIEDELLEPS